MITTLGSWTEPQGLAVQSDLKTVVVGLEQGNALLQHCDFSLQRGREP